MTEMTEDPISKISKDLILQREKIINSFCETFAVTHGTSEIELREILDTHYVEIQLMSDPLHWKYRLVKNE